MDSTIVIGAGPAGLAAAAHLRRAGRPAVVLEQGEAVAPQWRARYDRLRLNSPRWFSTLPGGPAFAGGTFPSRDEVVAYLEAYAAGLDIRFDTKVERLESMGDGWLVVTSRGSHRAAHVIVAGGYEHRPFMPAWPGRSRYTGEIIHAAGYREPSGYVGRDVLVVGPGCTGAEVAFDLVEGGAASVRLAVRTPPNIIVRQAVGAPLAVFFSRLPSGIGDAVMRFVRRRTIGDLSEFGLPMPEEGVFSRLQRLGVAPMIVDAEVIEAIRARRIEIVAAVEAFDEAGVVLADGSRVEPDAVIAATGYRPGLEPLVGHLGVLDDHGAPRVTDGEALPGLRFVGYDPRPAQLRHGGREAAKAAKAIARGPRSELVVGVLARPAAGGGGGH
ncbi:flavin-containing monooxygenase [Solirubrobacter soli]|uniref:flavin-containing monooxygenase n=1 Tax=Solirubrobacter soli TaxID=363832 RepID=UPI00040B3BC3|nr:NAD(P)/FAD-dependent oxidoreductase [Solirubrobacter soli]